MQLSGLSWQRKGKRATRICGCGLFIVITIALTMTTYAGEFKAGIALVDVTPNKFPVFVNGGMISRSYEKVSTRIHARALAMSDSSTTVVMVVVDSCMMPRPLLDDAKAAASKATGIPPERMLISATHTHSAPSCLACLGTDADPNYVPFLKEKLVQAISQATSRMQPAKIGYGKIDAAELTALRRWIRRPDRIAQDPFGNPTVRANMHAGGNWDDVTGESGPEDPDLSLIAVQTAQGKPLAVLANFSMHYFGDRDISADYYGRFCGKLKELIAPEGEFLGIMSHGCSGDIWRRDYRQPKEKWDRYPDINDYASALADRAQKVYKQIEFRDDVDVVMAESRLKMKYRVPDLQLLQWAQKIVEAMGDRPPKDRTEVYAKEQIILHERQETTIVVQAVRIGEIAITTTPNETYALTGLKIKAQSPLANTMVIELANGGDGYIPPPEQHLLGGYNTWAARSAGLEITAEPRIAQTCIELLEAVSSKPRREPRLSQGPACQTILNLKPVAWWRLNELKGPRAIDSSGNQRDAIYEPGVTFYLEGTHSKQFCSSGEKNRAAMFAGGRLQARFKGLNDHYSVSLWMWNGMPAEGRPVSGWLFSRGWDHGLATSSEHLGVGGSSGNTGRLVFFHGSNPADTVAGKTEIPRWTWQHVAFVRNGDRVAVYLNGKLELETKSTAVFPPGLDFLHLAGRSDRQSNWEGRLDEIAIFNRSLSPTEVAQLAAPSEMKP